MNSSTFPFQDTNLDFETRVNDLISRLTLKEKIAQMGYKAPAINRFGIPPYDWWNECLHGVARAGIATVFPQAIGMAATFNESLIFKTAQVISDEARAKHHEAVRNHDYGRYKGLTYWTPNVNIFRDPRWGRGQETYGEDPFLSARMGVSFIKGLQGDDPKYLKLVATPKHFAVHSGPERMRHKFNVQISKKELWETYLPQFKATVLEGKAESVMGAYNRVNDELACASPTLLQEILRNQWGFKGYIVSDCGAIANFHRTHKVTKKSYESAALGVNNGCDLNCGIVYRKLGKALKKNLISEATIDQSVKRLFMARYKLGMFDDGLCEYQKIPIDINDSEKHRNMALEVAKESIILLKNQDQLLPLGNNLKKIAVIGPNANDPQALFGNYSGSASKTVCPFEGIKALLSADTQVVYAKGCHIKKQNKEGFAEAIQIAQDSELIVMCLGISNEMEGEENRLKGDDRECVELPEIQQTLLKEIYAIGKPIVLVLINGGPISTPWAAKHIPAIIEAWYPGEEGGTAIAEVLFGKYSPAGRLPITIVKQTEDLPPFVDYSMKGRTYRFIEKEPLFPFGFGLSYTTFTYSDFTLEKTQINQGEPIKAKITITNTGSMQGDEVVQLYLQDLDASVPIPHWQLQGFQRISLKPGESDQLEFIISFEQMQVVLNDGTSVLEPGDFKVYIGGQQPDSRSYKLTGNQVHFQKFTVI